MAYRDAQVIEIATAQGGLVRRDQLVALGATHKVVGRLRRSGVLRQVTADVFVLAGVAISPERREQVALWEAGDHAALSHASAAARWAFPRVGAGAVEVVIPHGVPRPRSTIGRVHVTRCLKPEDVVALHGVRVTSPSRTVIDLACRLGPRHLEECLQDLRRRHLIDLDEMHEKLAMNPRRRVSGVARVERIVAHLGARPAGDSWLEDRFVEVLAEGGRRLPETQVWIVVDGHRYRVDGLWMPERLVVELDGHEFHSAKAHRRADAERAARITGAGYGLVVFTYDDVVDRPGYVLEMADHHLAMRRAA